MEIMTVMRATARRRPSAQGGNLLLKSIYFTGISKFQIFKLEQLKASPKWFQLILIPFYLFAIAITNVLYFLTY